MRYTAEEALNHVINIEDNDCEYESVFNDVEEVENCGDQNGTLWMSCSPGRDSEDDLQCLDDVDNLVPVQTYLPTNSRSTITELQPMERYIPIETSRESVESNENSMERFPQQSKPKVKDVKTKDRPNANKPISSYGLFFRDTQIAIKEQNPDTSFGEISRVVTTMWNNLDENHKQYYNKLAEEARQENKLLKKEKTIQVLQKVPIKKPVKDKRPHVERPDKSATSKSLKHSRTHSSRGSTDKIQVTTPAKCLREGCSNKAVEDLRWSKEYCSTQCVVSHCKDVYKAWVALRKSTTNETNST